MESCGRGLNLGCIYAAVVEGEAERHQCTCFEYPQASDHRRLEG